MKIDEAIEQLNEAKCGNCPTLFCEECVKGDKRNQIAEWLEELKVLRQQNGELRDVVASLDCQLGCVREDSYNKALNDLIEKAIEERDSIYDCNDNDMYEIGLRNGYKYCIKIAKNLKDGGVNE